MVSLAGSYRHRDPVRKKWDAVATRFPNTDRPAAHRQLPAHPVSLNAIAGPVLRLAVWSLSAIGYVGERVRMNQLPAFVIVMFFALIPPLMTVLSPKFKGPVDFIFVFVVSIQKFNISNKIFNTDAF